MHPDQALKAAGPRLRLAALAPLLDAMLALPPHERAAWVDALGPEHAAEQPLLRDMLAELSQGQPSQALPDDSLWQAWPAQLQQVLDEHAAGVGAAGPGAPAFEAGQAIGPYRLVRLLGEGGMGTVWLAERADGAFTRQVAMKLPLAGPQRLRLNERLARERDILAALVHPRIARLYDAGVADNGQPYLAMEVAEGEPITAHANARGLGVDARLRLFLQVLDAVQYAHNQLVVHRDLKPSNIVVDAQGQVHLLDFGIAVLLGQPGRDEAALTELGQAVLTPRYASPEQVARRPLGTSSDVYSLGVVLCELLTGARPYRLSHDSRAALEQAILDGEPVPPSQAPGLAPAAARRLRGDLDNIVLKALAKEPAQRYASADAFAADLQRHLDGLPVQAHPGRAVDRLLKFVRRHRTPVAAAASVVLALSAGLAVAWREAASAQRASVQAELSARQAQQERDKAQAVNAFLVELFEDPKGLRPGAADAYDLTARQLLDRAAGRLRQQGGASNAAQAELVFTLATMYHEADDDEKAIELLKDALAFTARTRGPQHPDTARMLASLGGAQFYAGDAAAAQQTLDQADAIFKALGDERSYGRGETYLNLARLAATRDAERAMALATQAAAVFEPLAPNLRAGSNLAVASNLIGYALLRRGEFAAAERQYRRALELHTRWEGAGHGKTGATHSNLSELYRRMGRFRDADAAMAEAVRIIKASEPDDAFDIAQTELRQASLLHDMGRRAEGRALIEHCIAVFDAAKGQGEASGRLARLRYAEMLGREGRLAAAERLVEPLLPQLEGQAQRRALLAIALGVRSRLLLARGAADEAREAAERGIALMQQAGTPRDLIALDLEHTLAATGLARGEAGAALARLRAAVPADTPPGVTLFAPQMGLRWLAGEAALRAGDGAAAEAQFAAMRAALQASGEADLHGEWLAAAALGLGRAHRLTREPAQARPELQTAERVLAQWHAPGSPDLAEARLALADGLLDLGDRPAARAQWLRAQQALAAQGTLAARYREALASVQARLAG
ncbi:MAG: serine/threonine-protein kinase [Burkholderiaceae bacterium]